MVLPGFRHATPWAIHRHTNSNPPVCSPGCSVAEPWAGPVANAGRKSIYTRRGSKVMNKNTRFALGLILFGAFLGCSSSTTPSGTTNGSAKMPGVGSTFIVDENAGGYLSERIYYVIQSGGPYYGKANALVAIDTLPVSGFDTIAYAYETNGDVSLFMHRTVGSWKAWITLPFQTQKAIISSDTDIVSGMGATIVAGPLGSTTDIISGASLATQSVRLITTITNGIPTIEDYHFAPSIGLLAMDSIVADPANGTPSTERKLVKYDLK